MTTTAQTTTARLVSLSDISSGSHLKALLAFAGMHKSYSIEGFNTIVEYYNSLGDPSMFEFDTFSKQWKEYTLREFLYKYFYNFYVNELIPLDILSLMEIKEQFNYISSFDTFHSYDEFIEYIDSNKEVLKNIKEDAVTNEQVKELFDKLVQYTPAQVIVELTKINTVMVWDWKS